MTDVGNPSNPLGHLTPRVGSPHRKEPVSLRSYDHAREGIRSYKTDRLPDERQKDRTILDAVCRSECGRTVASAAASTPYATHSRQSGWLEEQEQTFRLRRNKSYGRRHSPEHRGNQDRA